MTKAMWTATTRTQHVREGLRFVSDVTDNEWAVLAQTGARPRSPPRRLACDNPRRDGKPFATTASPPKNNSQTDSERCAVLARGVGREPDSGADVGMDEPLASNRASFWKGRDAAWIVRRWGSRDHDQRRRWLLPGW